MVFLEVPSDRSAGKKICKNLKVLISFLFEGYVPTINFDVQIVYHFVDRNFLWPTQWNVVKMMESAVVFEHLANVRPLNCCSVCIRVQ